MVGDLSPYLLQRLPGWQVMTMYSQFRSAMAATLAPGDFFSKVFPSGAYDAESALVR